MFVSKSMTKKVITIDKNADVLEAKEKITRYHIRHLPVVDKDHRLIGIITDRDVMTRIVASGLDPRTPVSRIMSSPLISINEDVGIEEAAEMMRDNRISRLIVKNDFEIVGIISETDIARIEPELHLLIREHSRLQMSSPGYKEGKSFAGYCEECGNHSELINTGGRWLCKECQ